MAFFIAPHTPKATHAKSTQKHSWHAFLSNVARINTTNIYWEQITQYNKQRNRTEMQTQSLIQHATGDKVNPVKLIDWKDKRRDEGKWKSERHHLRKKHSTVCWCSFHIYICLESQPFAGILGCGAFCKQILWKSSCWDLNVTYLRSPKFRVECNHLVALTMLGIIRLSVQWQHTLRGRRNWMLKENFYFKLLIISLSLSPSLLRILIADFQFV